MTLCTIRRRKRR